MGEVASGQARAVIPPPDTPHTRPINPYPEPSDAGLVWWGRRSEAANHQYGQGELCSQWCPHLFNNSLKEGVNHELSLLTVQNQILPCIGPSYACYLRFRAPLPHTFQENALDIVVDTFHSLVFISAVRECVTKTLQIPPSSRDALTSVAKRLGCKKTIL